MRNICILGKYVAILALSVLAMFLQSEALFAQCVVTSYVYGQVWVQTPYNPTNLAAFPTDAQLQKLTHVIASDIGYFSDGIYLCSKIFSSNAWNSQKNQLHLHFLNFLNINHKKKERYDKE